MNYCIWRLRGRAKNPSFPSMGDGVDYTLLKEKENAKGGRGLESRWWVLAWRYWIRGACVLCW